MLCVHHAASDGADGLSRAMPTMGAMRSAPRSSASRPRVAAAPVVRVIDGIEVTIVRKRIRNLYLRVRPQDGSSVVAASAPLRMPETQIEAFVRTKRAWILAQRRRAAEAAHAENALTPCAEWTPERKREAARRLEAQLPALLARWEPVIGRAPSHVTLRLMTSRWGSCTPRTGRVRLNLQLADLPPACLEYVLVHEMTHLWAGGHGTEFQRRMSAYLPQWRAMRRTMNRIVLA